MPQEPIRKTLHAEAVAPNLWAYEEVRFSFTWDAARNEFDGLPGPRPGEASLIARV